MIQCFPISRKVINSSFYNSYFEFSYHLIGENRLMASLKYVYRLFLLKPFKVVNIKLFIKVILKSIIKLLCTVKKVFKNG